MTKTLGLNSHKTIFAVTEEFHLLHGKGLMTPYLNPATRLVFHADRRGMRAFLMGAGASY